MEGIAKQLQEEDFSLYHSPVRNRLVLNDVGEISVLKSNKKGTIR